MLLFYHMTTKSVLGYGTVLLFIPEHGLIGGLLSLSGLQSVL
jgi:hypothetical protein